MPNVIQIKSGNAAPTTAVLADSELGFSKNEEALYIGKQVGSSKKVIKLTHKLDTQLATSGAAADAKVVGDKLNLKADSATVNSQLNGKADKTELAKKADKTELDTLKQKLSTKSSVAELIIIPGNSDLNSYLTPGSYVCPSTADSRTIQNCPVTVAFTLEVILISGGIIKQIIKDYSNSQTYERVYEVYSKEKFNHWHNVALNSYPVGSVYISFSNTSPAKLFGGAWEKIEGKFLLGTSVTHVLGTTGGEEKHLTTLSEMPHHGHGVPHGPYDSSLSGVKPGVNWRAKSAEDTGPNAESEYYYYPDTMLVGGNQPHNNMPPYVSVNMWKRVS